MKRVRLTVTIDAEAADYTPLSSATQAVQQWLNQGTYTITGGGGLQNAVVQITNAVLLPDSPPVTLADATGAFNPRNPQGLG